VLIGKYDLLGCNANLPGMFSQPSDSFFFTFFLITVVTEYFESGKELFEFHFPIENDGGGDDDEVLTPYAFVACEMGEE
jgi:hypothetical protein